MAIEILKGEKKGHLGQNEVRAKYLKNKVLKYLRIAREERSRYYLSVKEYVPNMENVAQASERTTGSLVERVIPDKEAISMTKFRATSGCSEPVLIMLKKKS